MGRTSLSDDEILEALNGAEKEQVRGMKSLLGDGKLKKQIVSFVISAGGNEYDAEEIYSDAMIKFWQNVMAGKFRGESKISSYVFGISKFQYLNKIRDQKVKTEEWKKDIEESGFTMEDQMIEKEYGKEMVQAVRRWMDKMSEVCKKVLEMYYWRKYNMKRVAHEMKYGDEQTAKKTVHRCRKQLRNIIKKDPVNMQAINSFGYGKF